MRRNGVRSIMYATIVAAMWVVKPAGAQSTQGVLLGQVTDALTTLAVGSARIECVNAETRQTLLATSDRYGFYAIPSLSPGRYAVTVTESGHQSQQARALEVTVASRVELNFRLRPLSDLWEAGRFGTWRIPGSQQTLAFYGPDVDTSRIAVFTVNSASSSPLETSRSDVVEQSAFDNLPLTGRDVYTMLLLLPGVSADTGTARGLGFSAFGQRPSSSEYLLDGADNNFLLTTGPLNAAAPEFIQEYRVSTGNYTAEYGRTSGFVANAITRGANGMWHGGGFFHLENQRLNANGFQENAHGIARRPMTQVEGGFTAGGPVIPRRVFLSGGLNRLRTKSLADPRPFVLPSAAFIRSTSADSYAGALFRQFPLPLAPPGSDDKALVMIATPADFSRSDVYARMDFNPTAADRVFVRFLRDALNQPDFLYSPYQGSSTPYIQASFSAGGGWTRNIGPASLNELRVARSGDSIRFEAPNSNVPQLNLFAETGIPADGQIYAVTLPGPQNQYNYRNRGASWEAADTLTVIQGRNLFKAGGSLFQRSVGLNLGFTPGGYLLFSGFSTLASGIPFLLNVEVDRYGAGFAPVQPARQYRYRQAYAFAQDSFRLNPRLTLDFGLRYERYGSPANIGATKDTLVTLGRGADIQSALTRAVAGTPSSTRDQTLYSSGGLDLGPRMGIAWDVTGTGTTVVRASYGIFYDRPFDNLWENAIQNRYMTAAFQDFPASLAAGSSTTAIEAAGTYTSSSQLVNGLIFQPAFRSPRVQNAFLGLQQPVRGWISLELNAIASRARGLITTDVINRVGSLPYTNDNPSGYLNTSLNTELDYRANQGKSQYEALGGTARFRRRSLFAQASYTWSHSQDNQSEPLANSFFNLNQFPAQQGDTPYSSAFTRQFDSGGDWAKSDFDQRQNFVLYAIWTPSSPFGGKLLKDLLRGWTISGLTAARAGLPFSVRAQQTVYTEPILNERADLVNPSQAVISKPGPGGRYLLNAAAFGLPSGVVGNTGRNAFTGPGLFSADVSLSRAFRVPVYREKTRVTVRADAYNFLNHANLNTPDSKWSEGSSFFGLAQKGRSEMASGFPLIPPLKETARIVQMMLRVEF